MSVNHKSIVLGLINCPNTRLTMATDPNMHMHPDASADGIKAVLFREAVKRISEGGGDGAGYYPIAVNYH